MLPHAIVLAGGRSSRFGSDKAQAKVDGRSLIGLCVSGLLELFGRVTVVAKEDSEFSVGKGDRVRVICDGSSVYAAMVGLAEGLRRSNRQLNYVIGCDMPLVARDLVKHLYRLARGRDCAFRCDESECPQPLGAFYSKRCLGVMDEMIESEDYRLSHVVQRSDAALLSYNEVLALDPMLMSFCNVNAPGDIEQVRIALAR